MFTATNPILKGFYPDPSICRVGDCYYLVNSTFTYFPGIPVFKSRDLCHFEQIGNALTSAEQLPLKNCPSDMGIFAPTVRYYNNTYYIICTNVSGGGNFIVTASDPAGPWSKPYFLGSDAAGIDPSLYFEADGRCYYVGSRESKNARYYGDYEIWLRELDLKNMKLVKDEKILWKGAMKDATWPESPHIYKKDGYYYLFIAESGTAIHHSISVARSESIFGEYKSCPHNPVFTHRHLGPDYPVVNAGHCDLILAPDGRWYIVLLASRRYNNHSYFGRETFLAKVSWHDGWPFVNEGLGKLEESFTLPYEEHPTAPPVTRLTPETGALPPNFIMLRNPTDFFGFTSDALRLRLLSEKITERKSPAYIGLRLSSLHCEINAELTLRSFLSNSEAGLALLQDDENNLRLTVTREDDNFYVQLVKCEKRKEKVVARLRISSLNCSLKIKIDGETARFSCICEGKKLVLADNLNFVFLSTESAGGFTGVTAGIYATANGNKNTGFADFRLFELKNAD